MLFLCSEMHSVLEIGFLASGFGFLVAFCRGKLLDELSSASVLYICCSGDGKVVAYAPIEHVPCEGVQYVQPLGGLKSHTLGQDRMWFR